LPAGANRGNERGGGAKESKLATTRGIHRQVLSKPLARRHRSDHGVVSRRFGAQQQTVSTSDFGDLRPAGVSRSRSPSGLYRSASGARGTAAPAQNPRRFRDLARRAVGYPELTAGDR